MSTHPGIGLLLDGGATSPKDGAGHSGSMFQVAIGCIDNGIGGFGGDIALHQLKGLPRCEHGLFYQAVHQNILPPIKKQGRDLRSRPVLPGNHACVACLTTAVNACGSRTARSASILRLRLMLAFFRVATNLL